MAVLDFGPFQMTLNFYSNLNTISMNIQRHEYLFPVSFEAWM